MPGRMQPSHRQTQDERWINAASRLPELDDCPSGIFLDRPAACFQNTPMISLTLLRRTGMKSSWLLTLAVLSSLLVAVSDSAFAADAASRKDRFTPEERSYWAFQPVTGPKVPSVRDSRWVRNPIDAFILSQLEAKGLRPSPPADRVTLLRRVTLDLVGLPPTPDEVEAFLKDSSPQAYEKVVDRLLQSPHYGERWARHWLDLARYAESEGFKSRRNPPQHLALPRLRDPFLQSGQTVRPFRPRANCGR